MSTYTIEELCDIGQPIAMRMLLRCLRQGEPFVTYGAIHDALLDEMDLEEIFSTHTGAVAGSLMNRILEFDPSAPLINLMITQANGIPGRGVGSYLAARYPRRHLRDWNALSDERKLEIVAQERALIYQYGRWDEVSQALFGTDEPWPEPGNEDSDHPGDGWGGEAESDEHLALKAWVAADPARIGLGKRYGTGRTEVRLESGDEVDVVFRHDIEIRPVEVKSRRSCYDDLKRGIYQCVKYQAVVTAQMVPHSVEVQAILVTEDELPADLKARARMLGVLCKSVGRIG